MKIAVLCNDRIGIPALRMLVQNKLVVAIGTSDRISEIAISLKQIAQSNAIPFQIFKHKSLEIDLTVWLNQHQPEVVLVKTFPWKIAGSVLCIPKYGFINYHYAPLPAFRGKNPLFWMIKNRVAEGGVTVHQMDKNLDTGNVLFFKLLPIYPEATFGMLCSQLANAAMEITVPLVQSIAENKLQSVAQNDSLSGWYDRPKGEDLLIDWKTMTSWDIRALAKACNPWQKGAVVKFRGWIFGFTDVSLSFFSVPSGTVPGTILTLDETNGMLIACCDGRAIKIDVIYCEEGYFPGHKMTQFGLKKGETLDNC